MKDLIRKRAEHNNGELSSLEEVALHQLDIERIEHIDRWCRELKILYLQSNLIARIENVSRLKQLEYLNLALNNIEVVENLEGCESLNKLDLTVNFIGLVTGVERLKVNCFLENLYLTGNPCTDFVGYREYVIATIPQLKYLDGLEIPKSDRISASQDLSSLRCDMLHQEKLFLRKREKEKQACNIDDTKPGFNKDWYTNTDDAHIEIKSADIQDEKDFWAKPTKYTPETRLETHRYLEEQKKTKENEKKKYFDPNPPKRVIRFFADDGRPLNINQAQIDFRLDDRDECYIVDVACYKHLSTSLIEVDVQPTYVRVTVKEKILQLVLNEEVQLDASEVKRSQTTGHLLLTLPKVKSILKNVSAKKNNLNVAPKTKPQKSNVSEKLEVSDKNANVDFRHIVSHDGSVVTAMIGPKKKDLLLKNDICLAAECDFIDDTDVPPLE